MSVKYTRRHPKDSISRAKKMLLRTGDKEQQKGISSYDQKSSSGTDIKRPKRTSSSRKKESFLAAESKSMERKRRLEEQQGERRFARVNALERADEELSAGPEDALENGMMQHPYLDNQRFDGVDPNLNPEPALNSTSRKEYDNAKREQEMEKQLRLGMVNAPKFNPNPRGP